MNTWNHLTVYKQLQYLIRCKQISSPSFKKPTNYLKTYMYILLIVFSQSAGAEKYTDCISAQG